MTYIVIATKSIQKDLNNLPDEIKERVNIKILLLSENPRPDGVTKLKGYENEYRLKVDDYRIRYEISDQNKTILLMQCKHRRDVYKS